MKETVRVSPIAREDNASLTTVLGFPAWGSWETSSGIGVADLLVTETRKYGSGAIHCPVVA